MKGIWKDGSVRFRRDNNISMRGVVGRSSRRSKERRAVHKGAREIESQLSDDDAQRIEEEIQSLKDMEEWAEYCMMEDIIREERRWN